MSKAISVFYCFPRSGGTLLNQCLLCSPKNVVFSEVNPAGCMRSIEEQSLAGFDLISPKEMELIRWETYIEKIEFLSKRCRKRGLALCLRDWPALNFLSNVSKRTPHPSKVLEQRLYLRRAGFDLREVGLVRRSRAVLASIRHHIPGMADLSFSNFAESYTAFLNAIGGTPLFQLERLQSTPALELKAITSILGLAFPADFATQFSSKRFVTGNTLLASHPPSAMWTEIRNPAPEEEASVPNADEPLYRALDKLAGYSDE